MSLVYLALGSNLGDREAYIRSGIRGLGAHGVAVIHRASLYCTEPLEVVDQPWFLNTVLEANTDLDPDKLLDACLEIEKQNCRVRETSKGPRTLDLDIIFYESKIIREPRLTIPHPRFSLRRFVLVPLNEIAPHFVDPLSGKTVRELLDRCPDSSCVRPVA